MFGKYGACAWLAATRVSPEGEESIFAMMLFMLLAAGVFLREISPRDLFARCTVEPNDERAWQEFLRRYRAGVHGAIYRILGHPPAGRYHYLFPDVLQRFHLRLLENRRRALHDFRGDQEESAQAYLRKIAASVALKMLPQPGRFKLPLESFLNETGDDAAMILPHHPGAGEDYIALLQDVEAGLAQILRGRKKYRNMLIFKIFFFYGFSPDDMIKVLGLKMSSPHAIEQLVYRTREKLARHLRFHNRDKRRT